MIYPCPKPAVRDKPKRKGLNPRNDERAEAKFKDAFLSEEYVEFVHGLGCAVPRCRRTNIECAHVGSTRKNGGRWFEIAPLCTSHHREQEGRTHAMDAEHGIDLMGIAAATALRFRERTKPPENAEIFRASSLSACPDEGGRLEIKDAAER